MSRRGRKSTGPRPSAVPAAPTNHDAAAPGPVAAHPAGALLTIRAQPGARSTGLSVERDGRLKVSVTAAPEQGRANEAIRLLLAASLDLRRGQLELVSGPTARTKQWLVQGLTAAELESRLRRALASAGR